MTDTALAPNREKRIVRLLRQSVWYVFPLGVAIGCLLVAARLAGIGAAPDNGTASTTGDDALVCPEPDWNFGSISQDAQKKQLEHEFVVKNQSNQAITISRITTNCGCAVAETSVGSVPPFGETIVRVKLNAQGKPGPLSKMATVYYGDDGAKELQLKMHCLITASAGLVTMPKHIDFGTVNLTNKSEQKSREFTVCRYDLSSLEITSVEANIPGVTCELVPPNGREVADALESCTVKVVVDPKVLCLNKPAGQVVRARIIVRTKHEGPTKGCVVPLLVTVE